MSMPFALAPGSPFGLYRPLPSAKGVRPGLDHPPSSRGEGDRSRDIIIPGVPTHELEENSDHRQSSKIESGCGIAHIADTNGWSMNTPGMGCRVVEPPVRADNSLLTCKLWGVFAADERRRRCENDEVKDAEEEVGVEEARL
jgi:hypothetical protein